MADLGPVIRVGLKCGEEGPGHQGGYRLLKTGHNVIRKVKRAGLADRVA
jgi:hypothetical protein